jgi:hypothetical protein
MMAANFDPGPRAIQIQYLNFRGEKKTFTGDRATLRPKGRHVSLRVAPSGRRVTFARDCIQNKDEVEAAIQVNPAPSSVEAQILGYYKKRGGSTPRYEELRRRFPGY